MLKAIETRYKGYRFRSRLEARWAVFFDTLGLKWEYEPEGFETSAGWYLPDFRVMTPQGVPCWYEVKPDGVKHDDKANAFALECGPRFALLSGDPVTHLGKTDVEICPRCGFLGRLGYGICDGYNELTGYGCMPCDFETPCGSGNDWQHDGVFGGSYQPHKGWIMSDDTTQAIARIAANKARGARFEHGEGK